MGCNRQLALGLKRLPHGDSQERRHKANPICGAFDPSPRHQASFYRRFSASDTKVMDGEVSGNADSPHGI